MVPLLQSRIIAISLAQDRILNVVHNTLEKVP